MFSFSTAQAEKISWKKLGKTRFVVWCHEQDNIFSSTYNMNLSTFYHANLRHFLGSETKLSILDSNTRVRIDWLTSVMTQSPIFKGSGHLFSPYFTFSYNFWFFNTQLYAIFYTGCFKMCPFLKYNIFKSIWLKTDFTHCNDYVFSYTGLSQ